MKCPRCQQENPPQAKFWLECGIADYGYALAGDGQQLRRDQPRAPFVSQAAVTLDTKMGGVT